MAVKNQTQTGDSDASYLKTLRDEQFLEELESHADRAQFNDKTGHIIATFSNDENERARANDAIFNLARTYAYEVVRTSANKNGMTVILG